MALRRRWRRRVFRRLFYDDAPEIWRNVLVAGTGRSGTTWIGDLLARSLPARVLFASLGRPVDDAV